MRRRSELAGLPTVEDAKRLIDALATGGRPAGSAREADARTLVGAALRESGFHVREERFEYSAWPGRFGTAAAGAYLCLLWSVLVLLSARWPATALLTLTLAGLALVTSGSWWMARYGTIRCPWMRRQGINLVARDAVSSTRAEPVMWLVAHIDSKSQPISIRARVVGVVAHGGAAAVALGALTATAFGWGSARAGFVPAAICAVVAALPIMASIVDDRSRGALDNATGVVAVVLAAGELRCRGRDVGVAITTAEELALAGARAWVRGRPPGRAVNCDTVDDDGALHCMWTRARALARSAQAHALRDPDMVVRHLIPGILVDGHALDAAGWDTVTVSRGTLKTLRRLHTPADAPESLSGAGAARAAAFIVDFVCEVLG